MPAAIHHGHGNLNAFLAAVVDGRFADAQCGNVVITVTAITLNFIGGLLTDGMLDCRVPRCAYQGAPRRYIRYTFEVTENYSGGMMFS